MQKDNWENKHYRNTEKLLNDFKNKRIGYSEFIEKSAKFIQEEISKAREEGYEKATRNEWARHIEFLQRQIDVAEIANDSVYENEMKKALENSLNWYHNLYGKDMKSSIYKKAGNQTIEEIEEWAGKNKIEDAGLEFEVREKYNEALRDLINHLKNLKQ